MPLTIALWFDKQLSADGAHYLVKIIDEGRVFFPVPSRIVPCYLTQWPVIACLEAGVTELEVLVRAHAFGVLSAQVLPLAVAWWASRGLPSWVRLLPAWSLVVFALPLDYVLVHEQIVGVALLWPLVFLLARPGKLLRTQQLAAAALAVLVARSYEPLALALTTLAVVTVILGGREQARERIVWAALLIALAAWAFTGTNHPSLVANRETYIHSLPQSVRDPTLLLPALITGIWLAGSGRWPQGAQTAGLVLALALLVLVVGKFVPVESVSSYGTRVGSAVWLPVLVAGAGWLLRASREWTPRLNGTWLLVLTLVAATHAVRQLPWLEYRREYRSLLAKSEGYLSWAELPPPVHRQGWHWTNPDLSLLWSPPQMKALVLNEPGRWQPYDPRTRLPLLGFREIAPELKPRPAK